CFRLRSSSYGGQAASRPSAKWRGNQASALLPPQESRDLELLVTLVIAEKIITRRRLGGLRLLRRTGMLRDDLCLGTRRRRGTRRAHDGLRAQRLIGFRLATTDADPAAALRFRIRQSLRQALPQRFDCAHGL